MTPVPKWSRIAHPLDEEVKYGSNRWRKECGDKIAYQNIHHAINGIEELSKKPAIHNEKGARLSIYECRWCEYLHIGHTRDGLSSRHRETLYVSLLC